MLRITCTALALAVLTSAAWADDKQPGLDKIKKLVGEWVALDDKGKPTDQVVSVFKIIAGGSAVQETIFPGKGEEMVSIYHMDGKDLLMTHYCSLGNQPRMKLDPKGKENQLKFEFAGGTNFDPAKDMHMHEGLITILDDNHIEWSWAAYDGGKLADHKVSMKLERKKK
jgi:hypothetical protein